MILWGLHIMDAKMLANKYKDELIEDLMGLLEIDSVKGESEVDAPVGNGPKKALEYMLELGKRDGQETKMVGNLAGHIEFGQGDDLFGILGHVDVVPPGSGWTTPPFEPVIRDNQIYARGVQDDKGPTMAAYYALKILQAEGYEFNQRVRVIIGTDEESDWECTTRYFDTEEMPSAGFSPDAEFPVIHGEKGITSFNIVQTELEDEFVDGDIELKAFISGERYNMVPESAMAKLKVLVNMSAVIQSFEGYLRKTQLSGDYEIDSGFLKLELQGQSAHGSTPEEGINAGIELLRFLYTLELDSNGRQFVSFANDYIFDNFKGQAFNMAHQHEELGEVIVNTGMINYTEVDGGDFGINLRYPQGLDFEKGIKAFRDLISEKGFNIEDIHDQVPHYVDKNDDLVVTLLESYRSHVNDTREAFTIGGGTYARTLERGVAFGAMFKNTVDTMHQKDEHMDIDELILATAIYIEAMYRLTVKH